MPFGKPGSREGRRARLRRYASLLALLPVLTLDLSACSFFLLEEEGELEPQRIAALKTADQEEAYPNLAGVPDQAPLPSSRVRRLVLQKGLTADRENAIYTDEDLRADPAILPMPQPAATPSVAGSIATASPAPADLSAPPPPDYVEQGDSAPPPAMPEPPAMPSMPSNGGMAAPAMPQTGPQAIEQPTMPDYRASPEVNAAQQQPTVLLQQQAVQVQIAEAQRLYSQAAQQQAMAEQARLQEIQQQVLRQQIIDRNAWQLQTLQYQAHMQMAALPQQIPVAPPPSSPAYPPAAAIYPQTPSLPQAPAYPQQPPGQPPLPGYPQVAAAYPPAGPAASAAPLGGDGFSAAQSVPGAQLGQLVGLIYFGHASSGLDENDRDVLRQIVALQQQGGRPIRIIGHASSRTAVVDPVQHRMANLEISKRRAESVARELVRLGIRQDQVMIVARSDSEPVYHEFMPTGEAGNRRVEIFLE